MTTIADLDPWLHAVDPHPTTFAVGWLETVVPEQSGNVDEPFFRKLVELMHDPWQPAIACGSHRCEMCRFTGGPGTVWYEQTKAGIGNLNLFVPAPEGVYVMPSLAAHYIDAHRYRPPDVFVRAVMECPPMRSMAYLQGIKSLATWLRRQHEAQALLRGVIARPPNPLPNTRSRSVPSARRSAWTARATWLAQCASNMIFH